MSEGICVFLSGESKSAASGPVISERIADGVLQMLANSQMVKLHKVRLTKMGEIVFQ